MRAVFLMGKKRRDTKTYSPAPLPYKTRVCHCTICVAQRFPQLKQLGLRGW